MRADDIPNDYKSWVKWVNGELRRLRNRPSGSGGGGGGAVDSVNGQTGTVVLNAGDVGAVESVNGEFGPTVTLSAADVGAAATSHTHAAADIVSGTIATARLGSGTADATTYLAGDQTYKTLPAAGERDALTPVTLNATYGDHFTSAALDAKWTRVGYVSGDEQHQQGGGTWMVVDVARAAANYYYQTCPSGDFTVVMKGSVISVGGVMFGPLILNNSANGVCCAAYNSNDGYFVLSVSAGSYGGTFQTRTVIFSNAHWSGIPAWWKLRKSGSNYFASMSHNGATWSRETASIAPSFTPTRMGFGSILNTPSQFAIDFFDVQ